MQPRPGGTNRWRAFIKRQLIGVADQGISSLSNLALTIAVARSTTQGGFGVFSIAITLYLLTTTLAKGMSGGIVALHLSHLEGHAFRQQANSALGAATAVGTASGAIILGSSSALQGGIPSAPLAVIAIAMPVLILQDCLRSVAYAAHRPWLAFANSATWFAAQGALFVLLYATNRATPTLLLIAWAAGVFPGLLAALAPLTLRPEASHVITWLKEHGETGRSLAVEYVFIGGLAQGAPLLLGWTAGSEALGGFRGAVTLFGPVTMAAHGLTLATVPVAARNWHRGSASFIRPLALVGITVTVGCILWGTLIASLPDNIGVAILGSTWHNAAKLAIIVGLWLGTGYATEPAAAAMRIRGDNRPAALTRAAFAPVTVLLLMAGALSHGAAGGIAGLLSASVMSFIAFWALCLRGKANPNSPDQIEN